MPDLLGPLPEHILSAGRDFEAWRASLTKLLLLHGLSSLLQHDRELRQRVTCGEFQFAHHIIRAQVEPRLYSRLPPTAQVIPYDTVEALRGLAKAFRFMDLPPELRVLVYTKLLPDSDVTAIDVKHQYAMRYPAITTVTREIRKEFMPIFYSHCVFSFKLRAEPRGLYYRPIAVRQAQVPAVAQLVRMWAKKRPAESLRHLREVRVCLRHPPNADYGFLRLTFTIKEGLRVHYSQHGRTKNA